MELLWYSFFYLLCGIFINVYSQPVNNNCANPTPLVSGETLFSQFTTGSDTNTLPCFNNDSPTVFYSYISTLEDSLIFISTCSPGTDFTTTIAFFILGCDTNSCYWSSDPSNFPVCSVGASDLMFINPSPGIPFIFAVYSENNGESGNFDIFLEEIPSHLDQDCSSPIDIYNKQPILDSNIVSNFPGAANSCSNSEGNLVFYRYVTEFDFGLLTISACNANFDTDITLINSDNAPCDICLFYIDGDCSGFKAVVNLDGLVPQNSELIIIVGGYSEDDNGVYVLDIQEDPINYECDSAAVILNGVPISSENTGFPLGSVLCDQNNIFVSYFIYTTETNFGSIIIDTCDTTADTVISVFTGDCNALNCYARNDDFCGLQSLIKFEKEFPANTDLIIAVNNFNGSPIRFTLSVVEKIEPSNANCLTPRVLFTGGSLTASTDSALNSKIEFGGCSASRSSPILFYSYTTIYNFGDITVNTCTFADFDTIIELYTGDCSNLNCLAENDDFCTRKSSYTLTENERLPFGTTIIIGVYGFDQDTGTFTILVEEVEILHPINEACQNATEIFNRQTLNGFSSNSLTTRNSLQDCIYFNDFNESPVVFYKYTTVFEYGDIKIDTCSGADFDTVITLYTGSCSNLKCISENNNNLECGRNSVVELSNEHRLPKETVIIIAVHGNFGDIGGEFMLTVVEIGYRDPSNSICENARTISNTNTLSGTTLGSRFLSSELPNEFCSEKPFIAGSPVVFYSYTTEFNTSTIQIDTCINANFDTFISVYDGNCGNLTCIGSSNNGCGVQSVVNLFGLDSGTELIIAVYGNSNTDSGLFSLSIEETSICSEEGPEYQCETSYTLYTDHKCDNGDQCIFIPEIYLGFCVGDEGCPCSINQISGIQEGNEVPEGIYVIESQAVSLTGQTSDICSFRINVDNSCNENGPTAICPELVQYKVSELCDFNGEPCYEYNGIIIGDCEDYTTCSCSTFQISGPTNGDKLIRGEYTIVISAINSSEFIAQETCSVNVIVN